MEIIEKEIYILLKMRMSHTALKVKKSSRKTFEK